MIVFLKKHYFSWHFLAFLGGDLCSAAYQIVGLECLVDVFVCVCICVYVWKTIVLFRYWLGFVVLVGLIKERFFGCPFLYLLLFCHE